MRTLALLIVILFLSYKGNAQTITPLPEFKNTIVVVKLHEELNTAVGFGFLDVSDGSEIKYFMKLESLRSKNNPENASILAQVFNELVKQKYKLIASNSGGGSVVNSMTQVTNYIFQKEP